MLSTEQCLVNSRCSKHVVKMEPWLIIWLNISQPATHKLHVTINYEIDAKKICEFKKYIDKLPEIQSCHSNDVTLTCNLSCFMAGEKVVWRLRAAVGFAETTYFIITAQEWISLLIVVKIINHTFTFPWFYLGGGLDFHIN